MVGAWLRGLVFGGWDLEPWRMTSYYEVFEVHAPTDEPSGISEGDSDWNAVELGGWRSYGEERDWSTSSWGTWQWGGRGGGLGENWSWDGRSMDSESHRSWPAGSVRDEVSPRA